MEAEPSVDQEEAAAGGKCFVPLQSRPYWAPVSHLALCPSMDLMTLSLQQQQQQQQQQADVKNDDEGQQQNTPSGNGSLSWLHRTLDFYQLSALGPTSAQAVWRPDGRWLAVVHNDRDDALQQCLTLYHVEAMVTHGANLASHVQASLTENPLVDYTVSPSGNMVQFHIVGGLVKNYQKNAQVCHLHWSHCVTTATTSLYEQLRVDASNVCDILPPSAYHLETHPQWVPTITQPLSVLTALKQNGTMDAYLLGFFPILQKMPIVGRETTTTTKKTKKNLAPAAAGGTFHHARVQSSLDLSHWWIYEQRPSSSATTSCACFLTLCSLPQLGKHRYTLQSVAVLYANISTHLHKLPARLGELSEAYASSLKPLDLKWSALYQKLQQYGLASEPVPKLLAQYILLGHASCTEDLSNAMDQFFTSMPMNDQLIQRMERSLTVAMANVESSLRQMLAACQAILVQVDALAGIARATSTPGLLPVDKVTDLHRVAQRLVVTTEACLTALVSGRFRLRDWIAWMRATGSAIKARGTASKSAQRENAKKRRLTDATLQRVLEYLSETTTTFLAEGGNKSTNESLSARIMGLPASRYWDNQRSTVAGEQNLWTLPEALNEITKSAKFSIMAAPRQYLQPLCRQTKVLLSEQEKPSDNGSVAVTSRQGALWRGAESPWTFPAEESSGYFNVPTEPRAAKVHQWTLVAHATGSSIDLYAVAMSSSLATSSETGEPEWDEFESDDEENDESSALNELESFYLTARLALPKDCQVEDMTFFGDDGQSNLHTDSDKSVQEKGQSLGFIVRRPEDTLELWVVPSYDKALWETHSLQVESSQEMNAAPTIRLSRCNGAATVLEQGSSGEDNEDDETSSPGTLSARVRVLNTSAGGTTPRLYVSGSRNIAAVVENQATHSRVGMWDLNEDEEEEEDDDEDEEMQEDD